MKEEFSVRRNAMELSSMAAFAGIKGGVNHNCKDVYFYRLLGTNPTFINDLEKMDTLLDAQMKQNRIFYKRISKLPLLTKPEDIDYYTGCYLKWMNHGKSRMVTRIFQENHLFSDVLGNACEEIILNYGKLNGQMNDTMKKNYVVKLIYWLDSLLVDLIPDWEFRLSVKIVADNICKKQEYLFFYLLTLLGFDVLLIQSRGDIDITLDAMQLSGKYTLGDFSGIEIPAVGHKKTQENMDSREVSGKVNTEVSRQQEQKITVRIPQRPYEGRSHRASDVQQPKHRDTRNHQDNKERVEKSYEELALLASSVVKIAIHDKSGEVLGTGSGIMIGKDGYILTNNHVASGGRFYSVRIEDDEQVYSTDQVIKYNPVLDLAIIRIQRTLNPLRIYNGKEKLVRGQRVVAIGSPLGLFNSVSDGIISGFRLIDNVDMIQFTAPISHGSSGGAVLNMYGEVIGISTAGIDSGQNINLAMGYECINLFVKGFI